MSTSIIEEPDELLDCLLVPPPLPLPGQPLPHKEPQIEWHFAERSPGDVADYLAKVGLILDDIASGKFYKRPGKHCAYCDFLPVCLGDEKKIQETLVRIT